MGKRPKSYDRVRKNSGQHRRILLLTLLFGSLLLGPVLWRLWGLMVRDYDFYSALALRNQTRTTSVTALRGCIYDRNMNVLADSQAVEHVYLDPNELKQSGADLDLLSQTLGQILEREPEWIRSRAEDTRRRYQQIGTGIDRETGAQIRAFINSRGISGIHLEPASRRVYPYGTLAAQTIGFTNAGGDGSEGVEASFDSFLSGKAGKVITTKGNNEMDMPFSYEDFLSSRQGDSLVLTLDVTVQACLENRLREAMDRYAVRNGAFGLVINAKTGEILAMATLGSYDPNKYLELTDPAAISRVEDLEEAYLEFPEGSEAYEAGKQAWSQALSAARLKQWRNRCISDGYEPGSTFKVLTMAAALDCGAIDLETSFHCTGSQQIPGRSQLLHCWRSQGHGSQKTPQALQNSCNIAFANIALKLGGERFYDYVERFGILEKTGIDLAGESKGIFFDKALVTDTDKWGTASLTSGSFGQTFKITPLQLVRAIASVVNGGLLPEPYLVSEILDADGNTVLRAEPTMTRRTISEETSRIMRKLITSVVTEGTAKNASVAGFTIGGKTGTSEKIDVFDENGQRVQDKIVSFVGIAPMEDPEYIVLAALDTPSRETGIYISGGVMAAPTVGAVMADILPYLGVAPNYTPEELPGRQIPVEDCTGLTEEAAARKLEASGFQVRAVGSGDTVTGQIPAAGQSVTGGSQVLLYLGEELPQVAVPDFTGMNRQQAAETAGKLGLQLRITGNTDLLPQVTVTGQIPAKDTRVTPGTLITLEFTHRLLRD